MALIDTHAHLYAKAFQTDIETVIRKSQEQNVAKVYLPNIDSRTIDAMQTLETKYPAYCTAMIGIHPCYIDNQFEQQLGWVEHWLGQRRFAAMGEIGMDLYHDKTFQSQQEEALNWQLACAQKHQLPVVIHCRNSLEKTLAILEKYQDGHLKGIFHCFSGSLKDAKRIIELGFHLGIGGIITFARSGLEQVVAALDLDHLVLETDAPYLAPVPYRGTRNEPSYLVHIAEKVAAIHGVKLDTVAQKTTENAKKVFGTVL